MKNQEIDIDLAKRLSEQIDLPEGVVLKRIHLHCKDCIHEELCMDKLPSLMVDDCEYFKNKADFVDIKRGEWIKPQFVAHRGFYEVKEFECSVCNKEYEVKQPCNLMNYCPYCGAKNK